ERTRRAAVGSGTVAVRSASGIRTRPAPHGAPRSAMPCDHGRRRSSRRPGQGDQSEVKGNRVSEHGPVDSDQQDRPPFDGAAPADHPAPESAAPDGGAAVTASGLHAEGPDGTVFGPLDLRIERGGLHILQGPSGSGRTTLLLALAGRFKVDGGTLDVLGRTRHAAVRRVCAIAGFRGVDEIDGSVRVRAVVHEQLAWNTPWYRRAPRIGDEAYEGTLRPVFGDLPLPS